MAIDADNLQALSGFADVAEEYCQFIDSLRDGVPEKVFTKLEATLPVLHRAILPVEEGLSGSKHDEYAALAMTHEQWTVVATAVQAAIGAQTIAAFEWHTEGSKETEPGVAALQEADGIRAEMLWDDLADIYRDLHNGLTLWRIATPEAQAEAAFQWRWNYEHHWGEHLFQAMLTVHEIRYQLFED